jgi:hypothetical protein
MNIHLHIDRLILDGLPLDYADRATLATAVENELALLLNGGGLATDLTSGATLASLRGASIQLRGGESANQLGTQIAQAVYGGIGNMDVPGPKEAIGERNNR